MQVQKIQILKFIRINVAIPFLDQMERLQELNNSFIVTVWLVVTYFIYYLWLMQVQKIQILKLIRINVAIPFLDQMERLQELNNSFIVTVWLVVTYFI